MMMSSFPSHNSWEIDAKKTKVKKPATTDDASINSLPKKLQLF
jgi:hypothetical protein